MVWRDVAGHRQPRALAWRTSSSEPAVETCVRCKRAPGTSRTTSARIARSRATAASSAAAGQPRSPAPSRRGRRSPRPRRSGSHPRDDRRSAARTPRRMPARCAGCPRIAPAPHRPSSRPRRHRPARPGRREGLACPPDRDRAVGQQFDRRAGRRGSGADRREDTLAHRARASCWACAQTVVNPPWAAAASPLATVSASSLPGSRRWACRSMNPGATTTPPGSTLCPRRHPPTR